jgi:hypothetical protein
MTDLGNARRFVARNKGRFAYCNIDGWLRWDGRRWTHNNSDALVLSAVHAVVDGLKREAETLPGAANETPTKMKGN